MSRSQLAEAVAAWIWNEHKTDVKLDQGYIAKLERGAVRRPGDLYRHGLRAVLGADSDDTLGMGFGKANLP